MAFYSLPTNIEKQVADYLRENYTGSYSISESFTVEPFKLPVVLVKAGRFTEVEPGMHVYRGSLSVLVLTQVDDVENPLAVHDEALALIYDLMSATDALQTHVNATGSRLHLFSIQSSGYDQEAAQGDAGERSLVSVFEYQINAQTLELP